MTDLYDLIEVARRYDAEDEPPSRHDLELDGLPLEEAMGLWRKVRQHIADAKLVEAAAASQIASILGDGGAARIGGHIVRFDRKRQEQCIDPDGFVAYMDGLISDGSVSVGDLVNPQYAKRGMLTTAARQTFYEWREDEEPTLRVTPVDRAPKWAQALEDGETTRR